jgi:hypothetical protein
MSRMSSVMSPLLTKVLFTVLHVLLFHSFLILLLSLRYCQECQESWLLALACRACTDTGVHGRGGYRPRGQGVPDDDDYGDNDGPNPSDGYGYYGRSDDDDDSEDEPIGADDY